MILETSVDRFRLAARPHGLRLFACAAIHLRGDFATRLLAHLAGRPALSLLLAGMSLPRHRFAPVIPPGCTPRRVQPGFQR